MRYPGPSALLFCACELHQIISPSAPGKAALGLTVKAVEAGPLDAFTGLPNFPEHQTFLSSGLF